MPQLRQGVGAPQAGAVAMLGLLEDRGAMKSTMGGWAMNKRPKQCSQHLNRLAVGGQECEGPLWESPRYFVDGSSLWVCEKHAKALMSVNPFGPTYNPPK